MVSDEFERHRPRLLRIAYRMLGSVSEAEDVVQDTWLRWRALDHGSIENEQAYLTTIASRLALNRLRRAQVERASYVGSWLPEPWQGEEPDQGDDLGYAAQVLLERLGAEERAAFLLRDVFDRDYAEIADTLEKSEPAVRKLVQRAKERLAEEGGAPRRSASRHDQRTLLTQLMSASRSTDGAALERVLSAAVQLVSDGGGRVFVARDVLYGLERVGLVLRRFFARMGVSLREELVELDGEPVLLGYLDGKLQQATLTRVEHGRITALYKVFNPDKLERLAKKHAEAVTSG